VIVRARKEGMLNRFHLYEVRTNDLRLLFSSSLEFNRNAHLCAITGHDRADGPIAGPVIAKGRPMPQRRLWLARGRMQSL
jgi:hypothetical protein